ncbi:YdeI/OmpD-associated family protein [Demequina capsici]|uniref:YdeI/OmpD-associated family protein n=1 Tax=Demequina capsici TaxID=3075620 RepID=A0AA96F621_9MICO|nr:YdeI/OmpD-associated family protein [Demequina sp. OYTSA14]WNM23989.1 YdeI/OmpD-associated family protein [Demequina sp. OYTSA14]
MAAPTPHQMLCVADATAWRAWLDLHEAESDGVWLVLAKKDVTQPTSLTYAQALDEALCSGWIDGQKRSNDERTFLQRFTPRRARSVWSARNVEHIARLQADGRMRPSGTVQVEAAKADGRWDRAYSGSADAVVPDDLVAALAGDPAAAARFEALTRAERYSVLHPLMTASTPEVRARRLAKAMTTLSGVPGGSEGRPS